MTYIVIPAHLFPQTALEMYRITQAVPVGVKARVLDIRDGVVVWERLT